MPKLFLTIVFTLFHVSMPALSQELFGEGQFADYQPDTANGETVFHASGCATCHAVEGDLGLLAGGRSFENRYGTIYAPNITQNERSGIGKWSDTQFLNAVLRGVSPDGDSYLSAYFPYPAYGLMKPEDGLDLLAFLKTLPESSLASEDHKINRFGRMAMNLSSNKRAALEGHEDAQIARGEYLVQSLGHCGECHTPRKRFKLNYDASFTGHAGYFGHRAPDISASELSKIDPEAFINGTLVEGKDLKGRALAAPSKLRLVASTSRLSLEDRSAIFAYLSGTSVDVSTISQARPSAPSIPVNSNDAPVVLASERSEKTGLEQQIAAYCEAPKQPQPARVTSNGAVPEDIEVAADQVMDKFCRNCHGPGQRNETVFPMHDISDMASDPTAVTPGNLDASPLYQSIALNRMPIGGNMKPTDVDAITDWIMALGDVQVEAPAPQAAAQQVKKAPAFVQGSMEDIILAAATDLRGMQENDRAYIRYFNFVNARLPFIECNPDGTAPNPMQYLHAGLNKLINSLSLSPRLTKVIPVDGTDGALVRIDIRDYDWTGEDWRIVSEGVYAEAVRNAGFSVEAWEDLAEVYPYAIDPSSDPLMSVIADATQASVPIMDADWFARFGSQSPYYDVLLKLTDDVIDLERRIGVDADYEISKGNVVRAGFTGSGVSDHNRMLERFDLPRQGYYWKSYDFAEDRGAQLLLTHPDGPSSVSQLSSGTTPFEHDGGEMIFSLPNGLQGYYLSEADGKRLLVGPTSIVSFRNKPIGKGVEIFNARSCFDCHENGILRKNDEIRANVLVSNRFSRDQRDALLEMYPPQEEIDRYYREDSEAFIRALEQLDAVETSAAGNLVSLRGPTASGGAEIVTYLADLQFERLDLEQTARIFTLSADEFRERVKTMGDPHLMRIIDGWLNRFDTGKEITRAELDEVWAAMLPRLTDYHALTRSSDGYTPTQVNNYEETALKALEQEAATAGSYQTSVDQLEAFQPAVKSDDPLTLSMVVSNTETRVNDVLEIDILANRRCELQVLYIEETETVEEFPQDVLGPTFLEAGEIRRIPYPNSGFQLRFDTPGEGETLVAFCREDALGEKRISAQEAIEYAESHFQPLSRGLIIERTETVLEDQGQSAVNAITFTVKP